MPHFEFGSNLLEHLLLKSGFHHNTKIKDFPPEDAVKLGESLNFASDFIKTEKKCGVIVQKVENRPSADGEQQEFHTYIEFHPYLFQQYLDKNVLKFDDYLMNFILMKLILTKFN